MYIRILGNIGVGKTTLMNRWTEEARDMGLVPIQVDEITDPYWLSRLQSHPEVVAPYMQAHMQLSQLMAEKVAWKQARDCHECHESVVVFNDYGSCSVFSKVLEARGMLNTSDFIYDIYRRLTVAGGMSATCCVYLTLPVPQLLGRIRERGRSSERWIDEDYLKAIDDGYREQVSQLEKLGIPVIMLDMGAAVHGHTLSSVLSEFVKVSW